MFLIYTDGSGNVTLSTQTGNGYNQPEYTRSFTDATPGKVRHSCRLADVRLVRMWAGFALGYVVSRSRGYARALWILIVIQCNIV